MRRRLPPAPCLALAAAHAPRSAGCATKHDLAAEAGRRSRVVRTPDADQRATGHAEAARRSCTPSSRRAITSAAQMNVALQELGIAEKDRPHVPAASTACTDWSTRCWAKMRKPRRISARRWRSRPTTRKSRHDWGAYLCTHGHAKESIPEFEYAARDPLYKAPEVALINAGKCSIGARRHAAAETYFRRALALKPLDPIAAYNLALLKYRARQPRRGTPADAHRHAAGEPAAAQALFLGHCIEQQEGRPDAEQSYVAAADAIATRSPTRRSRSSEERCQ